jgi:hypothetical protein
MLVYLGISIASIAASAAIYLQSNTRLDLISGASMAEGFVSEVNSNANIYSSIFYSYMPKGLCNKSVTGNLLNYQNRTYYFIRNVSMSLPSNCAGGGIEVIHTTLLQNGTLEVN